jgi:hypothetical protein
MYRSMWRESRSYVGSCLRGCVDDLRREYHPGCE